MRSGQKNVIVIIIMVGVFVIGAVAAIVLKRYNKQNRTTTHRK